MEDSCFHDDALVSPQQRAITIRAGPSPAGSAEKRFGYANVFFTLPRAITRIGCALHLWPAITNCWPATTIRMPLHVVRDKKNEAPTTGDWLPGLRGSDSLLGGSAGNRPDGDMLGSRHRFCIAPHAMQDLRCRVCYEVRVRNAFRASMALNIKQVACVDNWTSKCSTLYSVSSGSGHESTRSL